MFKLRSPCANCPFRKGMGERFQLRERRLEEIFEATSFQCHKTVDYYDDDEGPFINVDGEDFDEQWKPVKNMDKAQQCAGLMTVLHRAGRPNQIMQVAQRVGVLDPNTLDPRNEAYDTLEEVFEAHRGEGR